MSPRWMWVVGAVGLWSCSGNANVTETTVDGGSTLTESPDAGPPPTAPTIASFTASPAVVFEGQSQKTTLSWEQQGATTLSISPSVGNLPAGTTSVDVAPAAKTTTYTLTATNDRGTASRSVTVTLRPLKVGDWTFYGTGAGLSQDIQDVSADEGGNVYVAGGDALYVKRPADESFLRFDASNAGLTQNCNDEAQKTAATPSKPFYTCRIISVAGAAPGKAILGFDMFDIQEFDGHTWAEWPMKAGGADVVAFDGTGAGTLTRVRHVRVASPPHTICAWAEPAPGFYGRVTSCADPNNYWWVDGRRVFGRIVRIVVNHDRTSPLYGDVWMGAKHGTFSALLANAEARGLVDRSAPWGPEWADAKDVWEHEHPVVSGTLPGQSFVNGEGWALSIAPDGTPWGSNEYRTTYIGGYPDLTILNNPGAPDQNSDFWMGEPLLDLWPDPPNDYLTDQADNVRSMSHCPDGTLWIGSLTHGLVKRAPDGTLSHPPLPDSFKNSVSAVACDPSDGSLWIGLGQAGGIARYRSGTFERVDTTGLPAFATHPPQSIQIDRWSTPRVVYFAFMPYWDYTTGTGTITSGGGVAAYAGP